jgi:hypothetical protein
MMEEKLPTQLSLEDVDTLRSYINSGDRAGFYLWYSYLTGSREALLQAQVASFSGVIGAQAYYANMIVQAALWADGNSNLEDFGSE